MIRKEGKLEEGELLNKWINNRLIRQNKNILLAVTGPTGSGKSYWCLALANSWYKKYFGYPFPVKTHTCFSVTEVMRLIRDGELKRGELIILEEAGVNMGSLDFHSKVSKLFTYVLQSFRSMNVGIIFNLPYLTMMNKQSRTLIHAHFVTHSINQETKTSFAKGFFQQVNAQTGKVYSKFMRANLNRRVSKIKMFGFKMPEKDVTKPYEAKKVSFLSEITEEYTKKMEEVEKEKILKVSRVELTEKQQIAFELRSEGLTLKQIGENMGITIQSVHKMLELAKKKGFSPIIKEKRLENQLIHA